MRRNWFDLLISLYMTLFALTLIVVGLVGLVGPLLAARCSLSSRALRV